MSEQNNYLSGDIADNIKAVSRSKGYVIKEMLQELSLGVNTMSNMRHGCMISADSLARIADYLGVSVDYLLGRTDVPDSHKKG